MTERILGLDPGTLQFGYGLLEIRAGEGHCLAAGVFKAPRSLPLPNRLYAIHCDLLSLVETTHPTVIAVEEPYVPEGGRGSARSALAVGQAQALALLAAAQFGLPVHRYAPSQVKSAVSGYGQGSKAQVAAMVGLLLGLAKPPEPADAADALAVALCCLQQERLNLMANG